MLAYFKATAKCTTVEKLTDELTDKIPGPYSKWDEATGEWLFDRDTWLNKAVRSFRDSQLAKCDWTQLADSPLNAEQKTAWATYRQSLRDIPNNDELTPNNLVWPTEPEI